VRRTLKLLPVALVVVLLMGSSAAYALHPDQHGSKKEIDNF